MGFSFFGSSDKSKGQEQAAMWTVLSEAFQLDEIEKASMIKPQVLFKHSTRCIISKTVLRRFEQAWSSKDMDTYYLDLIAHRDISAAIAERWGITHQSPQVIVIKGGRAVYNSSHDMIQADTVERFA